MIPFKGYLYAGITLFVVGIFSYFLYSWHYGVIDNLESEVKILTIDNQAKDITINNLGVQIIQLMENNKIINFESYFKGYLENNATIMNEKLIF